MFRTVTIAIAITILTSSAFAVGPLGGLGAGIKAGLNYSDIVASDINSSARLGFIGGAYISIPLGKLKLQPEFLYAMRGYEVDTLDVTIELDYIEVPVLLRYDFASVAGSGPYVYAGPSFSFLQTAKSGDFDLEEFCQSNVTNAVVGGGFSIARVLNIDGRLLYGLSDVLDTSLLMAGDGGRHFSFSFMAVYPLGL